jgi:hypothetical protein
VNLQSQEDRSDECAKSWLGLYSPRECAIQEPVPEYTITTIDYGCGDNRVFWCLRVAGQFQALFCFPAVKLGLILNQEAFKNTYLNELDVRKSLVVSISQSEELRLYNVV